LCSEHTCATGTKKKASIDSTDDAGDPATTCCEAAKCSEYTCAAGYKEKTGVNQATTDQTADPAGTCCEVDTTKCASHTCAAGYNAKANSAGTDLTADGKTAAENCCEADATMCSSHTCATGTKRIGGTDGTLLDADSKTAAENCCEAAKCSEHTCATGTKAKTDVDAATTDQTADPAATCCEAAKCSEFVCGAGYAADTAKAQADQTATPTANCCTADATMCSSHTCTVAGQKKKADSDGTTKTDAPDAVCCEDDPTMCKAHTCAAGTKKIAASDGTAIGDDAAANCCEVDTTKCASHTCAAGYKAKADSAGIDLTADGKTAPENCCEVDATMCSSHTCAAGTKKIAGSDGTAKTEAPETVCCEAATCKDLTACEAGYVKKTGVDDSAQTAVPTAVCCDADPTMCASHTCVAGTLKIAASNGTLLAADGKTAAENCCAVDPAKCSSHTCADGYLAKANSAGTDKGDTPATTCCEADATKCASQTCAAGTEKKADSDATPIGDDAAAACCQNKLCKDFTCGIAQKYKDGVADTAQTAMPVEVCCMVDPTKQPPVPVKGTATFVAHAEMAEAQMAVHHMLAELLSVNPVDVMVNVTSVMNVAAARRLDGHGGVYTHTAMFEVHFADMAKAEDGHKILTDLSKAAAEASLKKHLVAVGAHEDAEPAWAVTLEAMEDKSCTAFTCPLAQKMKAGAAAVEPATPEACCEMDPTKTPPVKMMGNVSFVAEADTAQATMALHAMLASHLAINAVDIRSTLAGAMKIASTTRRLDGHGGVFTYTGPMEVHFVDYTAALAGFTKLNATTAAAAETLMQAELLKLTGHGDVAVEWVATLVAPVDPDTCAAYKCPAGQMVDATKAATKPTSDAECCVENPDASVMEVAGQMVFTADGTVENVKTGVEAMLTKTLMVNPADVTATVTAADVPAAGDARRLADQQFTADYVVAFSDEATAEAAHTALVALPADAAAAALKTELTTAGVTVPATFNVTKTQTAPVAASSGTGTTASGSVEAGVAAVAVIAVLAF